NSIKDGASLSLDDEDEEEVTEGEEIFFPFSSLGQKHGEWRRTIAFVNDFLHSINNHRSEVELSSNGQVVKHVCSTCVYLTSLAKGAKEIFPKE
ncbi:hypothetical protein Tco_0083174, partial [Tanacetum coccineum]